MESIYLCWIDDVEDFIKSYRGKIDLLEHEHDVKFIIDEHYSTKDFDTIARNIDHQLIFMVDYNLKGSDGNGVDGDELIKIIRQHNQTCPIVFYSSNATQEVLRSLVEGLSNVICALRESLNEVLTDIATGDIQNKIK